MLLCALPLLALSPAARADFADGLAAYDAGDYETAHEEWEPLAAAGDANALTALAGLYSDGNGVPRGFGAWSRDGVIAHSPVG